MLHLFSVISMEVEVEVLHLFSVISMEVEVPFVWCLV